MAKTLAELRAMHANMNTEGNSEKKENNDWISFDEGSNLIRFLPGKNDPLEFFAEGAIHRYEIPSEPYARNYKCRRTIGEVCPVCDLHWDMWKKHKELDLGKGPDGKNIQSKYGNLAASLKQKSRYFAVAVSRKIQETGEGNPVRMVGMSKTLFDKVMKALCSSDFQDENDPDNTTIISLESGNDFDITMTKKGNWNNFDESMAKFKKTKAGTPAQIAEWMDHTHDLAPLVVPDSLEDGKRIVMELLATVDTPPKTETTTEDGESGDIKV
tara:strand:- start:494 stop:1303 length:810 start_codon:yes stop_codon:yes gene_type:complete